MAAVRDGWPALWPPCHSAVSAGWRSDYPRSRPVRSLAHISSALLLAQLAACHWLLPLGPGPGASKDRATGIEGSLGSDRPAGLEQPGAPDLPRPGERSPRDLVGAHDRAADKVIAKADKPPADKPPADSKPTPDLCKCKTNEVCKGGTCVCPGCRDGAGTCQLGTAVTACGTAGVQCENCSLNPCLANASCSGTGCVGVNITGSCPGGNCASGVCCYGCINPATDSCETGLFDSLCGCGGADCVDCTTSSNPSWCLPGGKCTQTSPCI
jgi:hypothetical protein